MFCLTSRNVEQSQIILVTAVFICPCANYFHVDLRRPLTIHCNFNVFGETASCLGYVMFVVYVKIVTHRRMQLRNDLETMYR